MPYKVVSNAANKQLLSAHIRGKFQCSYSPDTWTVAPVGGLLCFDNLNAAKMFLCAERRGYLELWECEGEDRVSLGVWNMFNPTDGWETITKFPEVWWPPGTVAYKRVKLLKRIPFELPEC